jgi:hypothetical protein
MSFAPNHKIRGPEATMPGMDRKYQVAFFTLIVATRVSQLKSCEEQ